MAGDELALRLVVAALALGLGGLALFEEGLRLVEMTTVAPGPCGRRIRGERPGSLDVATR